MSEAVAAGSLTLAASYIGAMLSSNLVCFSLNTDRAPQPVGQFDVVRRLHQISFDPPCHYLVPYQLEGKRRSNRWASRILLKA